MKKLLYLLSSTVLFFTFFATGASFTFAQEMVLVATVNIYDAQIVAQDGNTINLSFDISNREGVQSQIKYGVELIEQKENGSQILIDTKVYDEELSLGENTKVSREVTYNAPDYLHGTYQVWLRSRNANGLLLSFKLAGEIKLDNGNDKEYIEISADKCFLNVVGEEGNPEYNIFQGVDISSTETLRMTCDVANHFDEDKTFSPSFETFHRSKFGKEVEHIEIEQETFNLQAGEQKTISFNLPKALEPQSYDLDLIFKDKRGNNVSNAVSIHYVLRGASATIQNVTLDNNFYAEGDMAVVSFFGSLAADNFPSSRGGHTILDDVTVAIKITDKNDEICAEESSQKLTSSDIKNEFQMAIIKECVSPTVSVSIVDGESGAKLDSGSFVFPSDIEEDKGIDIFIIAILVLIIIAIILFVWEKKKTKNSMLPSILILIIASAGFLFLDLPAANADTFIIPIIDIAHGDRVTDLTLTVDTHKDNYVLGEKIIVTASASYTNCDNTTASLDIEAQYDDNPSVPVLKQSGKGHILFGDSVIMPTLPPKSGSYTMNFSGAFSLFHSVYRDIYTETDTVGIPFAVLAPTISLSASSTACEIPCFVELTVTAKNMPVRAQ